MIQIGLQLYYGLSYFTWQWQYRYCSIRMLILTVFSWSLVVWKIPAGVLSDVFTPKISCYLGEKNNLLWIKCPYYVCNKFWQEKKSDWLMDYWLHVAKRSKVLLRNEFKTFLVLFEFLRWSSRVPSQNYVCVNIFLMSKCALMSIVLTELVSVREEMHYFIGLYVNITY